MPGKTSFGHGGTDKLVERQMRNWEIARSQHQGAPPAQRPEVEHFVAISRGVGAISGSDVAVLTTLADRLGWPVFDKEILRAMARDDRIRERLYETMDERDLGWFEETLRSVIQEGFTKNDYFHRLSETILALARQGRSIFIGRGADLILPRNRGLRVRLIASPERCAANFAADHQISLERARAEVARIETEQADFFRRHFKVHVADQHRHDLIVNVEQFTAAQTVELIITALKTRRLVAGA